MLTNNIKAFFELLRAGLWEKDARLSQYGTVDFKEILRLSEEQSVLGLIAAGIEHVVDVKLPQDVALQFVGQTLQIEQRNTAMNDFIADIVDKMRVADIYTILVKGQGVAQCYERPLWRVSGDIDFLCSRNNYKKAIDFLRPLASKINQEGHYSSHLSMTIDYWHVEVHGSLRTGLSGCLDRKVDEAQRDVFCHGNVRSWNNKETTVFLPSSDNDIFFVFTHFIKHFYKEGMNLRQVCDWCRLLWTYRNDVEPDVLEKRLRKAGLMAEWKAFAALAVDYFGMPKEVMPLYCDGMKWHRKDEHILQFILKGSRGKLRDMLTAASIFPWHTFKFLPAILWHLNWLKIKERVWG